MSLFKIREFWTTTSDEGEYFDQNSSIVTRLNSDYDYVITGSQSGVLRIFRPNCEVNSEGVYSGFHPNDLIVEKNFDSPILQVSSGRLISGNKNVHVAVLHPRLLSIYLLVDNPEKQEQGNQSYLQLMYEHKLRRSAANFVIGPFGGSQSRDFICVQSLDGILSFFEQESQVSYVTLPDFLLPGPLVYIYRTDSFLTVNSNWHITTYKYKSLSEIADESTDPVFSKPEILSEWTYNLGEPVIDIQVINDVINRETWIIVLGEKNWFCLTDNGRLRFMKKLDYCAVCMHTYVIDGNLFILAVAETNMLLVYENTTLKWSAHVHYLPIAIHRTFLKELKGALVLLSDEGRLECSYLGTDPSFFVAPPLNLQEIDFVKAEEELLDLEKTLNSSNDVDIALQDNIEKKLQVNVNVDSQIEVCTHEHNIKNAVSNYMSCIRINLIPQITFQEVQISIVVHRPLKLVPCNHFFRNLSENTTIVCHAFLDEAYDVPSLRVEVKVSTISNLGVPRAITRIAMLPAVLVLESCSPEKDNALKMTVSTNQTPVTLSILFPEYPDVNSANAIAFKSISGSVGTILLAKSSERYRLQSNTLTVLSMLVEQLIMRLKRHYSDACDYKINLSSPLPSKEIFTYIESHFVIKNKVIELQRQLSQLGAQFRLIQKRLITRYRAKNPTCLKSLELLLNDTYADICSITGKLEDEKDYLLKSQTDLSCALCLLKQMIDLLEIDSQMLDMIHSAFSSSVYDLEVQAWEDVMDASLCYLLRTVISKTDKDRLRAPHTSFDEMKDISKLEKHLNQVLERLPKQINFNASDGIFEDNDSENANEPEGKKKLEIPIGSQYGEFSSRLLSARKSLMKRHKINDSELNEAPNVLSK